MNHKGFIKSGANATLLTEIAKIKVGQTPEKLAEIYDVYKDDPKIAWKSEAKGIINTYLARKKAMFLGFLNGGKEHNQDSGGSYTRTRKPVKLVYPHEGPIILH